MGTKELIAQAEAAVKAQEFNTSVDLYTKAIELDEENAELWICRANANHKAGNPLEAVCDAHRAIELEPKEARAYATLGTILYDLEEFEAAKDAFKMASVLNPQRRSYHAWYEMCRVAIGESASTRKTPDNSDYIIPPTVGIWSADKNFLDERRASEEARIARKAAKEAETAIAAEEAQPAAKYRHQWFQSDSHVEINVLAKKMQKDKVQVEFGPQSVHMTTRNDEGVTDYELSIDLFGEIDPQTSTHAILTSKVEIKLAKVVPKLQWPCLEATDSKNTTTATTLPSQQRSLSVSSSTSNLAPGDDKNATSSLLYPYAGKRVDWDKIGQALAEEEDKEQDVTGDEGVIKFFRELYADADEDTRRAMMKSYQESGGTALSTNWQDVGSKSYKNIE